MTAVGDRPPPVIAETRPLEAPEKLRICEKVVAPTMMKRIIPEMPMVPRSEARRLARVSAP